MRYVIIGNGPAGMSAVKTILKEDNNARITLLGNEEVPPYSRILITHYLEGKIEQEKLFIYDELDLSRVEIKWPVEVVGIDTDKKKIYTDGSEFIAYDRLLIASGGTPKLPGIYGMDGDNIFTIRSFKDISAVRDRLDRARECLVLGGGMVSLKMTQALSKHKLDITLLISSDQIMSQALDRESADLVADYMKDKNIKIITGKSPQAILEKDGRKIVYLDADNRIETDLIIVGKGVSPNIQFINSKQIGMKRGIVVDQYLQTSARDVFAAGDVVETYNCVTGEKGINAIWPNAVEQGRIAALNMLGQKISYTGSVYMNSIQIFDIPVISIGTVKHQGELEEFAYNPPDSRIFKKFFFKEKTLVGAVLLGDIKNAGFYKQLICNRKIINSRKMLLAAKNNLIKNLVNL